ncbi:MAG TPA: DUF5110 domain-containing protein, partial [Candidatus Micrarchaeaceae archaeon]|nr:DUF5110 domain-containing protein [Candidatus Micrarchaeaceae archaeon]
YDWPEAASAYSAKGEYAFGDQMLAAPVATPADKLTGLSAESIWLPRGDWIEWPTGKHFSVADDAGAAFSRNFSLDQVPVYLRSGAIVPMQPRVLHTGEKPVDPLIVNVWPLAPGAASAYSVYEDSGAGVQYQRGVFTRTPIQASQSGDTLRVEIGPVQGTFPGMLRARSYELRLPADWPPASVTVNGVPVKRAASPGEKGWSFLGNTLTTIILVPSQSVATKVSIEVRRAPGLTARRSELDGFAGRITRLRAAYDALQQTWPVSESPDSLVDAMQSGTRLTYHPERAVAELQHFHQVLPQAQSAVASLTDSFNKNLAKQAATASPAAPTAEIEAQNQRRLNLLHRAQILVLEAGN